MMVSGKNRIMISGPKADGTYVVSSGRRRKPARSYGLG
jgi:hypothetical protein